ncbi:MAG TPA: tetratricopeptide repeat protein, partial [Balneolales bacterium]|nr:tetratricopeptide repeat protein [Balneolales bacterium]
YTIMVSVLFVDAIFFVTYCNRSGKKRKQSSNYKNQTNAFVGAEACKSCHESEYKKWKKSDHYHAMAVADSESVRGNFNNTHFKQNGVKYHFYKKRGNYYVNTIGADGNYHSYQIQYTFGWTPLQQYLIKFPGGKYQALTVAWDVNKKNWFFLYPKMKITPHDWLHWTKGAMTWNTMCADCHSTNLHQNLDVKTESFHTTWSEINVSCESCHGPGKQHVDYMHSLHGKKPDLNLMRSQLRMTKGTSAHKLVSECARCHSLREKFTNAFQHNEKFLDQYDPQLPHPADYYPDGQIKHEDYVYASFLQSKMYHYGVACTNCHNPHTYKLIATGNKLCLNCHADKYNTVTHTHHKPNTSASKCINCHMAGRNYMQIDFRRDHSFRIPRPDLTEKYNTPNACNNCHTNKSAKWAENNIMKWYGQKSPIDHFYNFTGVLAKADKEGPKAEDELIALAQNKSQPAIARATALWYLGQFLNNKSYPVIKKLLTAKNSLVRSNAVRALSGLPDQMKEEDLPALLSDTVRIVRIATANQLTGINTSNFTDEEQKAFKKAKKELQKNLNVNAYMPLGQLNLAEYYQKKKEYSKAITAYKSALIKDPHLNQARMSLSELYNQLNDNEKAINLLRVVIKQEPDFGPAYYSLALVTAQTGKEKDAIPYFRKAVSLMKNNARVYYNWAIVLQQLKRYKSSEDKYLHALKENPGNTDYQYGITTLYMQQKKYKKALLHAHKLVKLQPGNQRYRYILNTIKNNL